VVHRPGDEAVRELVTEYRGHPVATRVTDGDLSWSLRTGIDALVGRGSPRENEAVLICLADQPLLRLDVIRALVESWSRSGVKAIRPAYREAPGEPGHPLLVDRSLWHLAAEMRGETGFGPVLEAHRIRVQTISVGGRNPDVDTPEDLKALEEEGSAAER
jgi:CTP:molybdopterin cytidylyltransferase MocA